MRIALVSREYPPDTPKGGLATQTALLPDTPAELREGWIRVAPTASRAEEEPGE